MGRRESGSDQTIWHSGNLGRDGEGRVFITNWSGFVQLSDSTPQQVLCLLNFSAFPNCYPPKTIISELKINTILRRQGQEQSSWILQERVHQADDRRELRDWLRKKQKERLAVHQKHRQRLREREHKPFSTSGTVVRYVCLFIRDNVPLYYTLI